MNDVRVPRLLASIIYVSRIKWPRNDYVLHQLQPPAITDLWLEYDHTMWLAAIHALSMYTLVALCEMWSRNKAIYMLAITSILRDTFAATSKSLTRSDFLGITTSEARDIHGRVFEYDRRRVSQVYDYPKAISYISRVSWETALMHFIFRCRNIRNITSFYGSEN